MFVEVSKEAYARTQQLRKEHLRRRTTPESKECLTVNKYYKSDTMIAFLVAYGVEEITSWEPNLKLKS